LFENSKGLIWYIDIFILGKPVFRKPQRIDAAIYILKIEE